MRAPTVLCVLMVASLTGCRAREEAPVCAGNLHRIGRALHAYHDNEGAFPMAALLDKEGRPGLSWRVAILPYLGLKELHDKFRLDEPWDSPHNRTLLGAMPDVFSCPAATRKEPTLTHFQAFCGHGAFLEPAYDARHAPVWWTDDEGKPHFMPPPRNGVSMAAFTDGTTNTLMVVEAKEPVPWTKPADLRFDTRREVDPSVCADSPHGKRFGALFVDGSVHYLESSISPQRLQALITRNGDEVVGTVPP